VSNDDKPTCDAAQKRRDETLDLMLEGVKALCAGADALERRMDAFEESKKD
jgi:hypothetical protein